MSTVLQSELTVGFAWLAMWRPEDVNFLLRYVDDVVTDGDKQLLIELLQEYAFSPTRSEGGLAGSVSAIKRLRNMETTPTTSDGL